MCVHTFINKPNKRLFVLNKAMLYWLIDWTLKQDTNIADKLI